jgi:hypothetical protein
LLGEWSIGTIQCAAGLGTERGLQIRNGRMMRTQSGSQKKRKEHRKRCASSSSSEDAGADLEQIVVAISDHQSGGRGPELSN